MEGSIPQPPVLGFCTTYVLTDIRGRDHSEKIYEEYKEVCVKQINVIGTKEPCWISSSMEPCNRMSKKFGQNHDVLISREEAPREN